jgi:hypothetical protein
MEIGCNNACAAAHLEQDRIGTPPHGYHRRPVAMAARPRVRTADRLVFVWLYRLFSVLLGAAINFKLETVLRWQQSGFRLHWRWKSTSADSRAYRVSHLAWRSSPAVPSVGIIGMHTGPRGWDRFRIANVASSFTTVYR